MNDSNKKPTFRIGSSVTFQMGRGKRTGKVTDKFENGSLLVFCAETNRSYTVRASNAAANAS